MLPEWLDLEKAELSPDGELILPHNVLTMKPKWCIFAIWKKKTRGDWEFQGSKRVPVPVTVVFDRGIYKEYSAWVVGIQIKSDFFRVPKGGKHLN